MSHDATADRFRCRLMLECSNAELKILQNKIRPAGQRRMNRPPVIPPWAHKAKRGRRLPFQKATSDCDQASFLQALKKYSDSFHSWKLTSTVKTCQQKQTFATTFADFAGFFFPSKKSMPQAMRADQLSCDSDQTDPQRSIFCCWGPDFNLESKKSSKCTKNWPQSRKTISKSLEKNSKIRAFSRFSSPFRIGVKTQ